MHLAITGLNRAAAIIIPKSHSGWARRINWGTLRRGVGKLAPQCGVQNLARIGPESWDLDDIGTSGTS